MGKLVTISKEIEFDAGHRVPNHKSKCRSPHGHRYRVRAECVGRIVEEAGASDEGMLVDFGDLKMFMMKEIHDVLDHGFILWQDDGTLWNAMFVGDQDETDQGGWKLINFPYIPTAENIAIWCFERLHPLVDHHFRGNMFLDSITVWETPTSVATYRRPDNLMQDETIDSILAGG